MNARLIMKNKIRHASWIGTLSIVVIVCGLFTLHYIHFKKEYSFLIQEKYGLDFLDQIYESEFLNNFNTSSNSFQNIQKSLNAKGYIFSSQALQVAAINKNPQEFFRTLADETKLILDGDLERYYMIYLLAHHLPQMYFTLQSENKHALGHLLDEEALLIKRSLKIIKSSAQMDERFLQIERKLKKSPLAKSEITEDIFVLAKEIRTLLRNHFIQHIDHLWLMNVGSICFSILAILLSLFIHRYMVRTTYKAYKKFITDLRFKDHEIHQLKQKSLSNTKLASLGEMATGIVHEINNPLSVIYSRADLLKTHVDKGETISNQQMQEFLDKVVIYSQRISKIVKSMKTMARDSSQDPFELASIQDIIESSVDLCIDKVHKNHILFELYSPVDVFIKCRQVEISQVVINLVNNAIDAVKHQTAPWIRVSTDMHHDKFQIRVCDSGSGVSLELEEKIMQPFFTTKKAGEGTGLGLSISKNIAQNHGGRLFIDRTTSDSCFCLELPLTHTISESSKEDPITDSSAA